MGPTKSHRKWTATAVMACVSAQLFIGTAQAAEEVPTEWNTSPATAGAFLEGFEGADVPDWATGKGELVTATDTTPFGVDRLINWFPTQTKVLSLSADPAASCVVAYNEAGTSKINFQSQPVYVDLRVKFTKAGDTPDATLWADSKVALYLNSAGNLVAANADGLAVSDGDPYDEDTWYQLTVKLVGGTCNVLVNDDPVFTGLTLMDGGTASQLDSVDFFGKGEFDNLYVSHGDPARATPFPDTGDAGDNALLNIWLDGKTLSEPVTITQVGEAYLLNYVDNGTVGAPSAYTFGVSAIEVVSPTQLNVTLTLVIDGDPKVGAINGKVQIQGSTTSTGTFVELGEAFTPTFTAGEATYTFDIPEGGYKFFQATIVP